MPQNPTYRGLPNIINQLGFEAMLNQRQKPPIILALVLILFSSSCSNSAKKHQVSKKSFSNLSEEEINRRVRLEKYRRLREEDWENYRKKNKNLSSQKTKRRTQKIVLPPRPERPLEEIKIEYEQQLSFHCMKNRIPSEECLILGETANYSCQNENIQEWIPCLKNFLNTRKN